MANFGYEFRQYDSRLARWWSMDPKWNEYPSVSPFVFCNGSPIMLVDEKGQEASETSSLWTGTENDFELELKIKYQPFISLTDPPGGGKMQKLKEKISNGFHRLDMAIDNPYSPDPHEGHGDAWERRFAEKAKPYAMGGALMIPSWGVPNALITTATRKDIYGIEADKNEIGSAWISLGFTIVELAFPEFKSVNLIYNGVSNTFEIKKYKKQQDEEE